MEPSGIEPLTSWLQTIWLEAPFSLKSRSFAVFYAKMVNFNPGFHRYNEPQHVVERVVVMLGQIELMLTSVGHLRQTRMLAEAQMAR